MNILVLGNGAREHALCYAITKSQKLTKLFCAPGNYGISNVAEVHNFDINNFDMLYDFCTEKAIDLVVVGPEVPLVNGVVDFLEAKDIKAFGPKKVPAKLEGSKIFMKDICAQYNIPTAKYKNFIEKTAAEAYLHKQPLPVVIKASGLAAGKGVTIATTLDEGLNAINDIFNDKFGSGCELVIEEFMDGEEASYFVFTDGKNYIPLSSAQDHKRIGDGDTGPNTGGMGAYSPAPVFTQAIQDQVNKEMIEPTLKAMRDLGTPYQGILYAGVMIKNNYAKLVEYNVRFGDPECQVLMLRLRSDIVELILGTIEGNIHKIHTDWNNNHVATVVMASNGYPGEYKKGTIIRCLDTAEDHENIEIFHAGTEFKNNEVLAVGGRVLSVTSSDRDLKSALKNIYSAIKTIDWTESTYRKDIGWRAIENG